MGRKPTGQQAMTSAERSRKHRAAQSIEKKAEVKRKDAARHTYRRQQLKRNDKKGYIRLRQIERKSANKQKSPETPGPSENPKISYFKAHSTKSRSVKRARLSLPEDKGKRLEVLKTIFETDLQATPRKARLLSQWTNMKPRNLGGRPKIISEQVKAKLDVFLRRNDVSYTLPGRNNQIYTGKVNGKSTFAPKKYLLWTFNELAELVKDEDDEDLKNVKFSTLYRYISSNKEFVGISKIPQSSCLCPTCENFELLLTGISKVGVQLPTTCHDFIQKFCCDELTRSCAEESCPDCPKLDEKLEEIHDIESVSYYCWESGTKYQEKKLKEVPGSQASDMVKDVFSKLKTHYFNKRTQSKRYKELIDNLNPGEAVIHVDYSENYKNKQQNEIKAAYYGQGQFSIYTCCAYVKGEDGNIKVKNIALVTEENDHSGVVSFRLNETIITKIKESLGPNTLKKVHFWSDGCASQFRSQYAFYFLNLYEADLDIISWHFFEANHGKGAVDGVGGTVKHRVYREVLAGRVVVDSPKSFAEHANKLLDGIEVIYVEDMDTTIDEESRTHAQPVTGTLKVHKIERAVEQTETHLRFFFTSEVNEEPFCEKTFAVGNNKYDIGSYVLVKYDDVVYPGKIISIDSSAAEVDCMMKYGDCALTWKWPAKKDCLCYLIHDIVKPIKEPSVNQAKSTVRTIVFNVPEMADYQ